MPIETLTEREKECLRLLLHPMRAKEVAHVTGLSINTVNEHLKSARRKLGTNDSLSAAQMLRASEGAPNILDTKYWGSPPADVEVQKNATETSAPDAETADGSSVFPFASKGRPWNDLSLRWRLFWPLLLLGLVAIGAGAIVAGASELSELAITLTR